MKTPEFLTFAARFLRRSAYFTVAVGAITAGTARAGDTSLAWYGSGPEGALGGTGDWGATVPTQGWYDGTSYFTWPAAVAAYGPNNSNLIVANFAGAAGTVTLSNLGPNGSTFIGTVNVTTGGYQFAGTGTISLAAQNRLHLVVDTADNTPVTFGAGVSFTLRSNARTIQVGDGDTLNIAGVLDSGRIVKTGNGVLRLSGASTLDSATAITVSTGTVFFNNTTGSASGNGGVAVSAGATLGGTGSITTTAARTVTIGGTLSPGDHSASAFTIGFSNFDSRLVFEGGSTLDFTLGTVSDVVTFSAVGDWLSGSGLVTLNLTQAEGFSYDASYTIFENATTLDFSLQGVTGYDTSTYQANFALVGDDYVLTFAPVPEPSALALVTIGGVLTWWGLKRRKSRGRL